MYSVILENVSHVYPNGTNGLNNINLNIKSGDFVFLLGKSGSGKSTLLNLLTKELNPSKGKICFGQEDITNMKRKQIPFYRRKIGIIKEDSMLIENKTVYDNIKIALLATERVDSNLDYNIMSALGVVGMKKKWSSFPSELSRGEKSRVALARAIVNNPCVILADEPTAGLDNDASWDIMNLFNEINRKKVTVIMATHEKELVTIMKKRVVTLYKGNIIGDVKHGRYGDLI